MPTVLYAAHISFGLATSRRPLIEHFLDAGWQVVVLTADDEHADKLRDLGVTFEVLNWHRGGISLRHDIAAFRRIRSVYSTYRPVLAHQFHAKTTWMGTTAARQVSPHTRVVNSITGLGHAFLSGRAMRLVAGLGYRYTLHKADATIFQNPDDHRMFIDRGWVPPARAHLIVSSGVDTERFQPQARIDPTPRVLYVGRMMWQKGVGEFLEVARIVRQTRPDVRFEMAGAFDEVHKDGVPRATVQAAEDRGDVHYLGFLDDIATVLPQVDLFVLPSWREGLPRVVMECGACGVPSVGADVPGTREAIDHGVTGLLTPVKDPEAMAAAVLELLNDDARRKQMGVAARERAVARYDTRKIIQAQLDVYRSLGVHT